jgi:hypothetical protein
MENDLTKVYVGIKLEIGDTKNPKEGIINLKIDSMKRRNIT